MRTRSCVLLRRSVLIFILMIMKLAAHLHQGRSPGHRYEIAALSASASNFNLTQDRLRGDRLPSLATTCRG